MAESGSAIGLSSPAGTSAAALVAAAGAAFSRARALAGGEDVDLVVGGRPVRLSFAGDALRDVVLRAIAAGPATAPSSPALRIKVWDAVSTGVPLAIPRSLSALAGRLGLVDPLCDARFRVALGPVISLVDLQSGEAVYHVPDPEQLPYWERAHPARMVFAAWAPTAGLRMCHGAAVGDGRAGLLAVGSGGAGKSTVALACLGAGMSCAGDDYVLVESGASPRVHSLYASALLHPDHQQHWPELMPQVDNAQSIHEGEKAMTFRPPGHFKGGFELTAVVVPRVGDSASASVRPISSASALRALAPSSILQLGAFDAQTLPSLGALCRSLPCLELSLSRDVSQIPDAVRDALRFARAHPGSFA